MTEPEVRSDGFSWFNRWHDAYHQAAFRADLTGRRYRVYYEPENRWWIITELFTRHRSVGTTEPRQEDSNG